MKGGIYEIKMEKQTLNWILVILVIASLITSGLGYLAVGNIKVDAPSITDQDKVDIANGAAQLVLSNLPEPAVVEPVTPVVPEELDNSKIDTLVEELTDVAEEAMAEEVALAELETKDFKKDLVEFLNAVTIDEDGNSVDSASIDSYKDISLVDVKDTEVDVRRHGDKADVELTVKVSYFEDGDDDEEDIVKAKVKVTFEVEELDEDEDFEDVEIASTGFELVKFYE